jgi:hypothetical protein
MPGLIVASRLAPKLGPQFYKSFSLRRPLTSHWREATCEEVDCPDWRFGWFTTVDTSDDLGQRRYHFITHDKTRRPSVQHVGGSLWRFSFGPGFTCYRAHEHRVQIDRPPLLLVAEGDYRGNPRGIPAHVHQTAEDWADDFANHQDRLARAAS